MKDSVRDGDDKSDWVKIITTQKSYVRLTKLTKYFVGSETAGWEKLSVMSIQEIIYCIRYKNG